MAAIAAANVTVLYDSGSTAAERVVLYLLKTVDTADTYDVSGKFAEVKAAGFVAGGVLTAVGTVSISTTVLTMTLATMADDNVYLLVIGNAAV